MGLRNLGIFGSFIQEGWEKAFSVAKFFCFLHVTNTYLVSPAITYGPSMLPTIDLTTSVFLTESISARSGKVVRGDIITLQSPQNPIKSMTKRVVGIEGDTVTYISSPGNSDKHETVVADIVLASSYNNLLDICLSIALGVPKGHIWVQGDNIYNSYDSRYFGPVPYGLIEGRFFWRVSPHFGLFWKK